MRARNASNRNFLIQVAAFVCLLVAVLGVSAFSIPLRVEMLNNSGEDAVVSFKDDLHKVSSVEIKAGQVAEFSSLLERSFEIQMRGAGHRYRGRLMPEEFVAYRGWGPFLKRVLRVRLERDGCISLVAPEKKSVQGSLVTQPEGFPICPDQK